MSPSNSQYTKSTRPKLRIPVPVFRWILIDAACVLTVGANVGRGVGCRVGRFEGRL